MSSQNTEKYTCNCGKKFKRQISRQHFRSSYHFKNSSDNKDIDDILKRLAKYCIDNEFYRTDQFMGGYKHLSTKEIYEITNSRFNDSGYIFLDEECKDQEQKTGMIRLYSGLCNPKWSFWTENGVIKVDLA